MPKIRATLFFLLLANSLSLPGVLLSQEPTRDAQAALREIESLLAESTRVPPGSPVPPSDRLKVVSRIEQIVDHIESKPLPQDQAGWEVLPAIP